MLFQCSIDVRQALDWWWWTVAWNCFSRCYETNAHTHTHTRHHCTYVHNVFTQFPSCVLHLYRRIVQHYFTILMSTMYTDSCVHVYTYKSHVLQTWVNGAQLCHSRNIFIYIIYYFMSTCKLYVLWGIVNSALCFYPVFTAQCTLVQSVVLRSHVVRLWRWWFVIT